MKAFVYTKKGRIEAKELPDVRLDAHAEADRFAAVLRPRYLSPCSSDVHTVFAGDGPRRPDLVLGHEGLAEVVEVGAKVQDFRPGELVAVSAVMPERGDTTGHLGMPFSGTKLGRNINGMWSERFKVPDADCNLAHIPDGVSPEAALMAVDMMATGYTAAEEVALAAGQTVVVLGSGAVGLMAARAAAAELGKTGRVIVVGTDRDPVHAALARELGADVYVSYRDGRVLYPDMREDCQWEYPPKDPRANATGSPVVETIFRLTGGRGADRVLNCGGGPEALAQASDMVCYGGGIVVNMAYLEGSGMIGLPIFSLGRGMAGKTFKFVLSRGGRTWTERMLSIAAADQSVQGRLVTHRLHGFDAIPEALHLMKERPDGLVKIMVSIP